MSDRPRFFAVATNDHPQSKDAAILKLRIVAGDFADRFLHFVDGIVVVFPDEIEGRHGFRRDEKVRKVIKTKGLR